ncbi:MAG: hypothetical protein JW934_06915 [Anaerolineae bacterium]|nr:hypothetical protein [Anaerolineae bacterium]
MKFFRRQKNDSLGFDEFGNPVGKAFDLGSFDDDRLQGERILLFIAYTGTGESVEPQDVVNSVAERNLQMDVVFRKKGWPFKEADLAVYTQLWYLSDRHSYLNPQHVNLIREFNEAGNGVLLWADNEPYYADANLLARALANTSFSGNKMADKILTPGPRLAPGKFIEHPLTNGLNSLYEGITICTVAPVEHVTILAQSHDGQNCMACYEKDKQRVVFDTGFTKIVDGRFNRTAGTGRYFRNIAFWLANATRDSTYQLLTTPEKLATISQNETSTAYGYELKKTALLLYVLYWDGAAELSIEIRRPNGQVYKKMQGKEAPLQIEIHNAEAGVWTCSITGVKVETPDTPYVLTAVERESGRAVQSIQANQAQTSAFGDSWPCFMMVDCCEAVYVEAQAITEGVVSFVR